MEVDKRTYDNLKYSFDDNLEFHNFLNDHYLPDYQDCIEKFEKWREDGMPELTVENRKDYSF